jgi:hypothetical protein
MGIRQVIKTCTTCGGQGTLPCTQCAGSGSQGKTKCVTRTCPQCDGWSEGTTCSVCGGGGIVTETITETVSCPQCSGAGFSNCPRCNTDGTIVVDEWVPDTAVEALQALHVDVPVPDNSPHVTAAFSEDMRPDPVQNWISDAYAYQRQRGWTDSPQRMEEYENHVNESLEVGLEPLRYKDWDVQQRLREGQEGPHPLEEAGAEMTAGRLP